MQFVFASLKEKFLDYENFIGVRIVLMWCKGQVSEFGAVVLYLCVGGRWYL